MIIGIDTRATTKNKTGVGYLIQNLLFELLKIDSVNRYKFFGGDFGIKQKNLKVFKLPGFFQKGISFLWKKIFLLKANLFMGETDTFFFPNFVDFPSVAKKKVLLIPDLSYIFFPQFAEKKNLIFLKTNVPRAIRRADKILTISENAKKEIITHYGLPENKIEVVYLGCPINIHKIEDQNQIKKIKDKYNIKKNYILFVGTLEPRKNIEGLLEAYNLLDKNLQDQFEFVICGGKGWYWKNIFHKVEEIGIKDKIIFTGYVPESDLSFIYSGASLFAFPSFYEGFGIPILEAFACGVPVVCSNTSSLPEVGGDAAMYCNAGDILSIKDAIEKILNDKNLQKEMIKKGHEQLKKFSWEEAAKKISNILIS